MCQSCNAAAINGVLCHEQGCLDAWKDLTKECFECGCDFIPDSRYDRVCFDCLNPDLEYEDDWDDE